MTLNFWPFNYESQRRRKERNQAYDEHLAEIRGALMKGEGIKAGVREPDSGLQIGEAVEPYSPHPLSCSDCGGLFVEDKLKPTTFITVFSFPKPLVVTQKFFCTKCLPTADLEIELRNNKGDNLDMAYFSTREQWLQPFDLQGEEQTLVSTEDFAHLYCGDCGVLTGSKNTLCGQCSTPSPRKR